MSAALVAIPATRSQMADAPVPAAPRLSLAAQEQADPDYGPAAALRFADSYRGAAYIPGARQCYPDARGIPFSDTKNIFPMTASLWKPAQLAADFRQRMKDLPEKSRKRGIIVLLKTERCCTNGFRGCTDITAALEKRSTPLAADFLIYGVWILPRDGDDPPGTLTIETGENAWKNDAVKVYGFEQGPGATLAFIDPADGSTLGRTDALRLGMADEVFTANRGHAPKLDSELKRVLQQLAKKRIADWARSIDGKARARAGTPSWPTILAIADVERLISF
jgi:hypothetical protein